MYYERARWNQQRLELLEVVRGLPRATGVNIFAPFLGMGTVLEDLDVVAVVLSAAPWVESNLDAEVSIGNVHLVVLVHTTTVSVGTLDHHSAFGVLVLAQIRRRLATTSRVSMAAVLANTTRGTLTHARLAGRAVIVTAAAIEGGQSGRHTGWAKCYVWWYSKPLLERWKVRIGCVWRTRK